MNIVELELDETLADFEIQEKGACLFSDKPLRFELSRLNQYA